MTKISVRIRHCTALVLRKFLLPFPSFFISCDITPSLFPDFCPCNPLLLIWVECTSFCSLFPGSSVLCFYHLCLLSFLLCPILITIVQLLDLWSVDLSSLLLPHYSNISLALLVLPLSSLSSHVNYLWLRTVSCLSPCCCCHPSTLTLFILVPHVVSVCCLQQIHFFPFPFPLLYSKLKGTPIGKHGLGVGACALIIEWGMC